MEEQILELHEKLQELDKEKSRNPMIDLSQKRTPIIRQFIETFGRENDNQMLSEIASLKAKLVEVMEEHKVSTSLNSKTVNSLVKMQEKTQDALEEKTNELAKIKQELQKFQESKIVKNTFSNSGAPSKLGKNKRVNKNQIKTEVKVEVKKEPLKDLYMVYDNFKQIAKLTEGEDNGKLKEERYFDEVHEEMGIDFVHSQRYLIRMAD